MVSLDDAVVARLGRHGTTYEILVDPDGAERVLGALQAGEEPSDQDVLGIMAVEDVFLNARDGDRAPQEDLEKGFASTDVATIARRVLRDGDVQLTQDQRKRMLAQKEKGILAYIARHAWNPQTRTPHPKDRIERALEEAKFQVHPLRRVEEQVAEAMKALRPLMPIAFERVKVAVRVPAEHAGAAYGHVRNMGELKGEEWQEDGALVVVLEMPAGAQGEVYERLNKLTQGAVETRLV